LTTLAVTPAPAALILSRNVARVSSAPTVMLTGSRPTCGTKFIGGWSQLPISSVITPLPTSSVDDDSALAATTVWLLASRVVATL
jgi:hypothetical protein